MNYTLTIHCQPNGKYVMQGDTPNESLVASAGGLALAVEWCLSFAFGEGERPPLQVVEVEYPFVDPATLGGIEADEFARQMADEAAAEALEARQDEADWRNDAS